METFFSLLDFSAGNSPVTDELPWQRPVTRNFDAFFDLRWLNNWVKNRDAGDLKRYRAHYDVAIIIIKNWLKTNRAETLYNRHLGIHDSIFCDT